MSDRAHNSARRVSPTVPREQFDAVLARALSAEAERDKVREQNIRNAIDWTARDKALQARASSVEADLAQLRERVEELERAIGEHRAEWISQAGEGHKDVDPRDRRLWRHYVPFAETRQFEPPPPAPQEVDRNG